jgi:cation-transporting ATPase I
VALAALVGTQLGQTIVMGRRSPVVLASGLVSVGALGIIVQTPGLSQFFGCRPLGPAGWAIATGSATIATVGSVIADVLIGRTESATAPVAAPERPGPRLVAVPGEEEFTPATPE